MRKKRCFSKKFGEMSKFPVQRSANTHDAVEKRAKQPPQTAENPRQNPSQKGHCDTAQRTAVQQKSQHAAHDIIAAEFSPCQHGGKTEQCSRPQQQERHIFQSRRQLAVGQQQPERPQHTTPSGIPSSTAKISSRVCSGTVKKVSSCIIGTAFPAGTADRGDPFPRIAAARCRR